MEEVEKPSEEVEKASKEGLEKPCAESVKSEESIKSEDSVKEKPKSDEQIKKEKLVKTVKIKNVRKRTKGLIKNVQSQMEFYFSDSNLQKDRFIKQEIDKNTDGYVDLSLFLKFNKIKNMTEDLSIIKKAVSKSDKLQLNEDGSRLKRKTPFVERDIADIDSRTVYVECLPRTVDHDWMKRVFSECGAVNYVSLPKFKTSGDPKGFGFVEFDTQEDAVKACKLLNNPPVEVGNRPGKFPKSNKQLEQLKKQGVTDEMAVEVAESTEVKCDTTPSKSKRKRRRNTSESSVDYSDLSQKKSKRSSVDDGAGTDGNEGARKSLDESFTKSEDEGTRPKKKKKKKKNRRSVETNKTDEENETTETATSSHSNNKLAAGDNGKETKSLGHHSDSTGTESDIKKTENGSESSETEVGKNRKRKRGLSDETKIEGQSDNVDIIPQKQKRKMTGSFDGSSESDQKSDIKVKKKSRNSVEFSDPVAQTIKEDKKKKKRRKRKKKEIKEAETLHLRVLPKVEWLKLRKQYLKIQKTNMSVLKTKLQSQWQQEENKPDKLDNKTKTIDFIPGVIVKVKSRVPLEKKEMRELFNTDIQIAYLDVSDGDTSGFVRCKDATSADLLVKSEMEDYHLDLVTGVDEENYWQKLKSDRENKLSNKHRPKKRGMQKLVDRAENIHAERLDKKHVFFDE